MDIFKKARCGLDPAWICFRVRPETVHQHVNALLSSTIPRTAGSLPGRRIPPAVAGRQNGRLLPAPSTCLPGTVPRLGAPCPN